MKLTLELNRIDEGYVTGRLIDTESGEGLLYETSVRVDETRVAQTRVLRELARHLNWFVDLSEGGMK